MFRYITEITHCLAPFLRDMVLQEPVANAYMLKSAQFRESIIMLSVQNMIMRKSILIVWLNVPVNSYGHISSPTTLNFLGKLSYAVNQYFVHIQSLTDNFMIYLHKSLEPGWDQTRDPWIRRQTRICIQTRYHLRYATRLCWYVCSK